MATLRELIIKISANSQSFQSEIARASRMGNDYHRTMQNGGRQAAAAARESQRALAEVNAQLVSVRSSAMGMAGAFAGAFATGHLISLSDQWNLVNARLKQASTSTQDFTSSQAALMALSQRTGTAFADNAGLFARSAASLREYGYSSQDALKVTEALATGLKLSGAGVQESSSVITQFSQALAQGVLRGEEFNSVNENGDRVIRALAAGMGVARKDLKAMADDGKLTADKVVPALISQLGAMQKEFEAMPATVGGSVTKVQNAFQQWVGGVNQTSGVTATLSGTLDSLADNIDSVATAAGALVAVGTTRYFGNMATRAASATSELISAAKNEVALAAAQQQGAQSTLEKVSAERLSATAAQRSLVAQLELVKTEKTRTAIRSQLAQNSLLITRLVQQETVATNELAAAQTRLNTLTSVGSRLWGVTSGLIGGIPGAIALASFGAYAWYQRQEQIHQSALDYLKTLDDVKAKMRDMSLPAIDETSRKIAASIKEQNKEVEGQTKKVNDLRSAIAFYQKQLQNPAQGVNTSDLQSGIDSMINKLSVEESRLQQLLNDRKTALSGQEQAEQRRVDLLRQQAAEQNKHTQALRKMTGQYEDFNRALSLGNQLLSSREGLVNIPFRLPDNPLSNKQNDALEKSRQDLALSKLKGEARERQRLAYAADSLGFTNIPSDQKARQEYIDNGVAKWKNIEANKPKAKGPKSEEEKAVDTYDRLIKQQRERLALGSSNTELAKMAYQTSQGELATLTEIQKKRLLDNATLIDQAEIKKKAAQYENGLIDSNANAKAANDTNLIGFGEGARFRERMKETINIRREFIQKDDELRRQHQAGEIDDEFFNQAIALNKRYLDKRLGDQQMYYTSLDAQRNNWMGGMRDGFADWADDATDYATQASQGMKTAMSGAVGSITEMLNGNVDSWKDWGVNVLKIIENVLVNMAVANAAQSASGVFGSLFGIGASAMAGGVGAASANNAFTTGAYGNLSFNALGGVYDSPSLSAYSGGVYSTPQLFAFAKGAGVFGEAGPEAIMPLTRSANGSLGVRAIMPDTSAMSGGAPQVTVNISSDGQVSQTSTPGYEQFGREIGQFVDQRFKALLQKETGQGRMLSPARLAGRRS